MNMFLIVRKTLAILFSFALVSVSSNSLEALVGSITTGDGVTFPYIESKILVQNVERTVLFVSSDVCEECIKAAELRCGVLNEMNASCVVYLLVNNELNLLTLVPVEDSKVDGLMRPVNSNYKYVFRVNSSIDSFIAQGETSGLKEKLREIESLVNNANDKPKLIYLVFSENGVETQCVYLGDGRISKLGGRSNYYAFLYSGHSNKVNALSRTELRVIEQARRRFIEMLGELSEESLGEERVKELAARLRTLDLVIKDAEGCSGCGRLGSTCKRCPSVVSFEVEQVYYNLARANSRYSISIESRLSRFTERTSVASLFVASDAADRLPNFDNSIKINGIGDINSQSELSFRLGPNCSDLSEKDLELVEKIIASFSSYFSFGPKQDFDEICIAVSKMSKLENTNKNNDSEEPSTYSIDSCIISMALSLGNFYPEFISEFGTLSPENESKLIDLCSNVLGEESLEISLPLPRYSLSGSFRSPTGGKLNAAVLLLKSVSEEAVVSSILGEGKCSYEDLFNGGWKFERKLRVWTRVTNGKVPIPIMVRFGLTIDGKLAAFSMEERDIIGHQKGVDVLLTDPEYCTSHSSVIGDECTSSSDIDNLRVTTSKFRENALAELEQARKNAELAERNSKRASRIAAEAIVRCEEATEDEVRAIELADIATKLREYHDKKRVFTERAVELANLEERLTVATERRADASLLVADALEKATEAEARRRKASLDARDAAMKATEKIRNALEVQRQLKSKLSEKTKLKSAYDSAVVAEERLKAIYAEAQESLRKIIEEEKEASEKYSREMALLLEEESRLKKLIKESSAQRKSLLVKLADFNAIISAKYDESIITREKLAENIRARRDDLKTRKAELDAVLKLSGEKSTELMTVSSTIDEYEKVLSEMRHLARKNENALVDSSKYNEMTVKLDGLKNVFESLTKRLETLASTQKEMDEIIKTKEKELDILVSGMEAVEDRISRYEYLKVKIEEKSREAAELFAKEAILSEKLLEIERTRKRKTLELEKLAAVQTSAKSDISSTLAARGAALGTVRASLKEIGEARKENEALTKEFRNKFIKSSEEVEESMAELEEMEKLVCSAINEEECKGKDLRKKVESANSLREEELVALSIYDDISSAEEPEPPKTPVIPKYKLEETE
ncbi:coiled coil [Cryptosporidium bovis]|uniref:coiled coil n=3 Tax=Cryptosporidium TaxID=5806 RepID=UPI00351A045E|nr:coiled coil [Cryptosporidium bovis]